ncbi:MAG: hypothetical protein ACXABY_13910, partial [Candidatus Thorarchaeota archaeon]
IYSGSGYGFGLDLSGGGNTVYNCIIYDWKTHATSRGISASGGTNVIYNTTIWNSGGAGVVNFGTMTLKNCVSALSPDDFLNFGSLTVDYCASDDGDGTNAVAPSGGDWDNEFTDKDNGDFSLAGGNCQDGGTDDPGSGAYNDDIISTLRSSPWSIGAFGTAASGGSSPGGGGGGKGRGRGGGEGGGGGRKIGKGWQTRRAVYNKRWLFT